QPLRRDAGFSENLSGLALLLDRERDQEALDRDIGIARLFRGLLRGVEHTRKRGREVQLSRAGAFYFGNLAERRLDGVERFPRLAARAVDQAGGQPLGIVKQHLEQVLGAELLVSFAQRERLRRLHESSRPFGVFLEIHSPSPWP